MKWLLVQWPYATFFAAFFLLALILPFERFMGLPLTLVYAQLVIYMFHQVEEHYHDRFRAFVNQQIGKGKEALTPVATFWINSLGVWGCDFIALYLAIYVNLSLGLIAVYMTVINGLSHIVMAIVKRCYNPGLLTSIFLFIPIGVWADFVISSASGAGLSAHLLALAIAVLIHVAIIGHIRLRLRRLNAAA